MKTVLCVLLVCLGICLFSSPAWAKRKHQSPQPTPAPLATPGAEPPPLPSEAAPELTPGAPPSASLQPFIDTHLGEILEPLGVSAFAQPELLGSMKASYADGMAAAPDTHKSAYVLAQNVCDAMIGAITERQNAVAALRGALATRSSEAEQPRGGSEAVSTARDKDAFFLDSQRNTWTQRAGVLRQNITALYLRERAVERQVGVWSPPPPAPNVAPAASNAGSPVSAAVVPAMPPPAPAPPPPSAERSDPVVGQWMLEGGSPLTLAADHSITGGRHGSWLYTCTTGGGRNYELHWNPPKDWVDYLVLSGDGRSLDGKTRKNKPISVFRQ